MLVSNMPRSKVQVGVVELELQVSMCVVVRLIATINMYVLLL